VKRKLLLVCFPIVTAVFALAGCGYKLTSDPTLVSRLSGKKVAIPMFTNKGYRANVGAILTSSLVEEFAKRTGGRVTREDEADLILSGAVITYASTAASRSQFDRVKQYRSTVTAEATLTEKATSKVLWKGTLSWSQDYPVPTMPVRNQNVPLARHNPAFQQFSSSLHTSMHTNVALLENNEEAAIREICAKLAQQFYERITADF
jgi:outer membrane lipopolysaccharide assembly protein LptE/RlpB